MSTPNDPKPEPQVSEAVTTPIETVSDAAVKGEERIAVLLASSPYQIKTVQRIIQRAIDASQPASAAPDKLKEIIALVDGFNVADDTCVMHREGFRRIKVVALAASATDGAQQDSAGAGNTDSAGLRSHQETGDPQNDTSYTGQIATLRRQVQQLLDHCDKEGGECSVCSQIICPHFDELHFHHDGCPSCSGDIAQPVSSPSQSPTASELPAEGQTERGADGRAETGEDTKRLEYCAIHGAYGFFDHDTYTEYPVTPAMVRARIDADRASSNSNPVSSPTSSQKFHVQRSPVPEGKPLC